MPTPVLRTEAQRLVHELNNVLLLVMAHAEALGDATGDGSVRDAADAITQAVRRGVSVLDRFRRSEAAPGSTGVRAGGYSVLLVDDEEGLRTLLSQALIREGFHVTVAETGAQALDACGGQPRFDLLIADMMLPDISGTEVAAHVRATAPDVAILFMSGYSEAAELAAATTAGDRFVAKPFSLNTFRQTVRETLDARRLSA